MEQILNLGLLVTLPLLFKFLKSRSGINSQIRFELHNTGWICRSTGSIPGTMFVQSTGRRFYPKCFMLVCRVSCCLSSKGGQPPLRMQREDVIWNPASLRMEALYWA